MGLIMAQAKAVLGGLPGNSIANLLGLAMAHVVDVGEDLSRAGARSLTEFGHGDPVSERDRNQVPCGSIQGFAVVEHFGVFPYKKYDEGWSTGWVERMGFSFQGATGLRNLLGTRPEALADLAW